MKRIAFFLVMIVITFVAFAGKPLYSSKYKVMKSETKGYEVSVDFFKNYITVNNRRCQITNDIDGWKIYEAGQNGGYTTLYFVDPTDFTMKYVIQHDGIKEEFPMVNQDTTMTQAERHNMCEACGGTGRIAVNEPWNTAVKSSTTEHCNECDKDFLLSDGHRHESCTKCGGRGYTVERIKALEDMNR